MPDHDNNRYLHGPDEHGRPRGCRCKRCKAAHRDYMRRRRRLVAYGQWQAPVDAEPIRQHVRALMAAPEPWVHIAKRAGVSQGAVARLLWGDRGHPPTKRMFRATADALLALAPQPRPWSVDVTGTRRRAQALVAIGWTYTHQAGQLGMTWQAYLEALKRPRVTARTARAVADLYERLSGTPAPSTWVTERARRKAARAGWAPPLAWDDETIDDPAAQPTGLATPHRRGRQPEMVDEVKVRRACDGELRWRDLTRGEKTALVHRLRQRGWTRTSIARFLGASGATVAAYDDQPTAGMVVAVDEVA